MLSLWKDFDRIGMPSLLGWDPSQLLVTSPVEVKYEGDYVVITADMPGVDPQNLDLTFEGGSLSIVGQRGDHRYRYSVNLGDEYNGDTIEAELDKGVLTIKAEKRAEAKPRKIALKGWEPTKSLEIGEAT